MRHALYLPPFATFGDASLLVELAVSAEQTGWDGFFLWDHLMYQSDVAFVDAWITLAAVAASTERIRLGPLITPLPRRRPWKVARESVTLDHLSHGRLTLGVGLGIDFWHEFSAFGEGADDDKARAELLDDGIDILFALWSGESVDYEGRRLRVDHARFLPGPLQQPRIPVWSAALWPPRPGPLRRAARCDGVMPFDERGPLAPDDVRTLRTQIQRLRTDDAPFDICLYGGPAPDVAAYEEAGATWLVESMLPEEDLDWVRETVAAGPPRAS